MKKSKKWNFDMQSSLCFQITLAISFYWKLKWDLIFCEKNLQNTPKKTYFILL